MVPAHSSDTGTARVSPGLRPVPPARLPPAAAAQCPEKRPPDTRWCRSRPPRRAPEPRPPISSLETHYPSHVLLCDLIVPADCGGNMEGRPGPFGPGKSACYSTTVSCGTTLMNGENVAVRPK